MGTLAGGAVLVLHSLPLLVNLISTSAWTLPPCDADGCTWIETNNGIHLMVRLVSVVPAITLKSFLRLLMASPKADVPSLDVRSTVTTVTSD
jgi:hypothetical protein